MADKGISQKLEVGSRCETNLQVRACRPEGLSLSDGEAEGDYQRTLITVGGGLTGEFCTPLLQRGCHPVFERERSRREEAGGRSGRPQRKAVLVEAGECRRLKPLMRSCLASKRAGFRYRR